MKKSRGVFILIVCLLFAAVPVLAHHGRGAKYDMKSQVALKGTITQILWRNPHIGIFLDVKDENGKVTNWAIEHSNVTTLATQGYGHNTLHVGEQVTAYVYPGTGGAPVGLCIKFITADGKQIFQRAAGGGGVE
jgi:Family of unknown function (DUF6152)